MSAPRPARITREPVMTETVRALVRRLSRTWREFAEAMPCTWCNNIGVVPEEAFGRDEDGAPMVDGVQPCPEGCEVPRWLQAERNDARGDAAELDRLSAAADPVTGQARGELRCDRCGRSSADSDRDMAAPVVFFVRQGLCTPCSRSTALPPAPLGTDTNPDGAS